MTDYPAQFLSLRRWVCYRRKKNDKDKLQNVPHLVSGILGDVLDRKNWRSHAEAEKARQAKKMDGLSFVLCADDGFVCIDLDACRDAEWGVTEEWAEKIIEEVDSYTELSPSGTGYHIWVSATIPKNSHASGSKLEMYSQKKVMAMSGTVQHGRAIKERDLAKLFERAESGEFSPERRKSVSEPVNGHESERDWAIIGEIFRRGITDPDDMEATFKRDHPERFIGQNRKHKNRKGKTYVRYSVDNFLENESQRPAPAPESSPEQPEEIIEAALPVFPQFAGSLHDIAVSLAPLLPYVYKFGALATLIGAEIAGRIRIKAAGVTDIEPRFFSVLLGEIGAGKSPAKEESENIFKRLQPMAHLQSSEDSAADLVSSLHDHPRLILNPDEFARCMRGADGGLIAKLPDLLLELHKGHTAENFAKKNYEIHKLRGIEVRDAQLAILGTSQPTTFDRMWVGSLAGSAGLHSRLSLFAAAANVVPMSGRDNSEPALTEAFERLKNQFASLPGIFQPLEIPCSDDILRKIDSWTTARSDARAITKISDHVMRWLILLAFSNDEREITQQLLHQALAMMDYQIAAAALYLQPDASDRFDKMQKAIIHAFHHWKQVQASRGISDPAMSQVEIKRQVSPQNRDGGFYVFGNALKSLQTEDVHVVVDTKRRNHKGFKLFVLDDYST